MHRVNFSFPAVIKALCQIGKDFCRIVVRVGPVSCGIKATTEMGFAAIAKHRRETAPGWAVFFAFLIVITQREGCRVGNIRVENARDKFLAIMVALNPGITVFITGDHAATHVAGLR
ncbi:hypothetical protein D3C80_1078380 [compost metagenome]